MNLTLALLLAPLLQVADTDLRTAYDVEAYALDLHVRPAEQELSGTMTLVATVVADELTILELDLSNELVVERVDLALETGKEGLDFDHSDDRLRFNVPLKKEGERIEATVRYHGSPQALNDFDGFHWARTADGQPWVSTSCQSPGSRSWWPCKDSYFHPEDKPQRFETRLTVPKGLYGVSNGRLVSRTVVGDEETFLWRHEYPLETYSVTLNVAPYEVVETELELPGIEGTVPFVYYVLPENAEKAALQFTDVARLLEIYSEAFGPYPFPRSKYALVETSFWGMEHSTAVAYGSSYPAWCKLEGEQDPYAGRNGWFDYILVHETAHEWWGNAVSVADWGDFWIHEGLGTYSEAVYVEHMHGREAADRYLQSVMFLVPDKGSVYRGEGVDSGQAYDTIVYYKGAWVLQTMRHVLDDDEAWWRTLRAFNLEFRYGNATTADFRAVLERESGRSWEQFFDEWFYGSGFPQITGTVSVEDGQVRVEITNEGTDGTGFHVPLDLVWTEGGGRIHRRIDLAPGANDLTLDCSAAPSDVKVVHLERVLGRHEIKVK